MRFALLALAAAGVVAACGDEPLPLTVETACDDAGHSIASRTFTCTGDAALSNQRYANYTAQYICTTTAAQPLEQLYGCPVAINRLPCERVELLGDDLAGYLRTSTVCASLVKRGQQ